MAKIVKSITMTSIVFETSNNTVYPNGVIPFYWDSSLYPNSSIYLEAVGKAQISNYWGEVSLCEPDGTIVADSTSRFTSTALTRKRSAAFTFPHDNTLYHIKVSSYSGAVGVLVYGVRIVIIQEATPITATETCISIGHGETALVGTSTSYAQYISSSFPYDSAQIDGTVQVFLEGKLCSYYAAGTVYAKVYDTDGNAIEGSEVSVAGNVLTYVRSSAFTLTTGKTYIVKYKCTQYQTIMYSWGMRLVIQQTNSPKKTVSVIELRTSSTLNTASTSEVELLSGGYWDNDEWSVVSKAVYFESTFRVSNAANTGTMYLNDGATNISTLTTQSATLVRVRGTGLAITDNSELKLRWKVSAGTIYLVSGSLIVVVEIVASSTILTYTDTGVGNDLPKSNKLLSLADSGAGVDAETKIEVYIFADTGEGVDGLGTYKIKGYADTGEGVEDGLLIDKIINFSESGNAIEVLGKPTASNVFYESGIGIDNPLANKILELSDSGVGTEKFLKMLTTLFADSAVGADIFLKYWTTGFLDSGKAIEVFNVSYPYPINLKRIIIFIRDKV